MVIPGSVCGAPRLQTRRVRKSGLILTFASGWVEALCTVFILILIMGFSSSVNNYGQNRVFLLLINCIILRTLLCESTLELTKLSLKAALSRRLNRLCCSSSSSSASQTRSISTRARVQTSDSNSEQHRIPGIHLPGLVLAPTRLHIIIRERVAATIHNSDLVHEASIVIRSHHRRRRRRRPLSISTTLIPIERARTRRMPPRLQQRRPRKRRRETRYDGVAQRRRPRRERPAVAPQDVGRVRLAERLPADHERARRRVGRARYDAGPRLRVDVQRGAVAALVSRRVVPHHGVDVRLEVAGEAGSDRIAVGGAEDAEDLLLVCSSSSSSFLVNDELIPRPAVARGLLAQALREAVRAVGRGPRDALDGAAGAGESQADGDPRHEVHEAHVRVQLRAVERELGEPEVHVPVRIARVQHAGLDERCRVASRRVEEEAELFWTPGYPL